MCCGYGITFDSAGSWKFHNAFARNVVIFGVDNKSSSHTDNSSKLLVLAEGPIPTIKMLTFQISFASEVYLMDLVLLSLKKYL